MHRQSNILLYIIKSPSILQLMGFFVDKLFGLGGMKKWQFCCFDFSFLHMIKTSIFFFTVKHFQYLHYLLREPKHSPIFRQIQVLILLITGLVIMTLPWSATDSRTDQVINGRAITIRNGSVSSNAYSQWN